MADGGDSDNGKHSGVEFVARIADVTGADLAASTDLTGAAGQGGDWNLEYTIGQIDGANLALTSFDGLLNDAPTATDDTGTTDQNTLLTGDLLLNDTDPNGDDLTISAVGSTAANQATANLATATDGSNGGSFTIHADGAYTFNPDGDFDDLAPGATTTTQVTYTVSDGNGGTDTATLDDNHHRRRHLRRHPVCPGGRCRPHHPRPHRPARPRPQQPPPWQTPTRA